MAGGSTCQPKFSRRADFGTTPLISSVVPPPPLGSWEAMLIRCTQPSQPYWRWCGGRGITVCERRDPRQGGSFANFLADMGERPPGKTLDRIDVNGGYEPGNVRWADAKTQRVNQRPR
jgi:hypothetical protein